MIKHSHFSTIKMHNKITGFTLLTLNYLEHIDMENKSINIIIDINENYNHQSSLNVFVSKEINNKVNFEILKFTENGFERKIPDFPYTSDYIDKININSRTLLSSKMKT